MKKINWEIVKKIDYALILFTFFVLIIAFIVNLIVNAVRKPKYTPSHIDIVDINNQSSVKEIEESFDFLRKVDDVYIFTISTNAISSTDLSESGYSPSISNAMGNFGKDKQIINFCFLKDSKETTLFSSKLFVYKYELKNTNEIKPEPPVGSSYLYPEHNFNIYAAIKEDTNNDKKLDSRDNISLFVSDYDGKNLQEISSSIYYLECIEYNKYIYTEYKDNKLSFYEYDGNTKKITFLKSIEQKPLTKEIKLWG